MNVLVGKNAGKPVRSPTTSSGGKSIKTGAKMRKNGAKSVESGLDKQKGNVKLI